MSDTENAAEAINNDVYTEEGPESGSGILDGDSPSQNIHTETEDDNIDYISFAKVQGWAPKEKWRGNPDQWIDAQTFVKRGQEFQSTLKQKNQNLERKLEEQEATGRRTIKMFERLSEKARDDALKQLRSEQKLALEDDNDSRYDELEKKKAEVYKEHQASTSTSTSQQQINPAVAAFQADNPWYGSDPIMTDAAVRYCEVQNRNGLSLIDQLEATKRYMVKHFPDEFENPRRKIATSVSANNAPSKMKKTRGWGDIPAADQKVAENIIRSGVVNKTQYIKEYFALENLT